VPNVIPAWFHAAATDQVHIEDLVQRMQAAQNLPQKANG